LHTFLLFSLLALPLPLSSFIVSLDLLLFSSLALLLSLALDLGVLAFRLLLYPLQFLEAPYLFVA